MINHHTAYLVCNNTGKTFKILDVSELVKDIVNNHSEWAAYHYFFDKYSLEDCHGKSLSHIAEEAIVAKSKERDAHRALRWGALGGFKRKCGTCLRHPKTTAELREIEGLEADGYGNLVRGRRKQVPTVYDDIWRPHFTNWKSFRKKQYK